MPGKTAADKRAELIQQLMDDPDPPPFDIDDLDSYVGPNGVNESLRMIWRLAEATGPSFKRMKQYQVDLSPEERAQVMKAKAVWHFNPKGNATPAVWKSIVKGVTYFTTNTHRAYQTRPTLQGAIGIYHSFIKSTA